MPERLTNEKENKELFELFREEEKKKTLGFLL